MYLMPVISFSVIDRKRGVSNITTDTYVAGPYWAIRDSGSINGEKRVFLDFFYMTLHT